MADRWERDTFVAINVQRDKAGLAPLSWCCALESNARGSCAGIIFHKFRVNMRVARVVCPHWTQPEVIAGMLIGCDRHILDSKYQSGAMILSNDRSRTFALLAYGKGKPVSWEGMPHSTVCPYCHAGQTGDISYGGHHTAHLDPAASDIEVEVYHCRRCGRSWSCPH
jgi:hypothetical protein